MPIPVSSQRQRLMHEKMHRSGKAKTPKGKKLPEKAPKKKGSR